MLFFFRAFFLFSSLEYALWYILTVAGPVLRHLYPTPYQACRDYGFFYLINHGISDEFVAEVFTQSRAFFSLPIEQKDLVLVDKKNRGFTPMGEQSLDPVDQTQGDTKEGYYIYRNTKGKSEEKKPLRGQNQWPSGDTLPGWRKTMEEYYDAMNALGARLAKILAVGLNLEPSYFEGMFMEPMSALRLLHYSAKVSNPGEGILGAGAHTDWGLLTFLAMDNVPGLQVLHNGAWRDVPPVAGAFICNVGDMLKRWTNDHLHSAKHRVVNRLGCERYSVPFFFEPAFDTEVMCMPQFCSDKNPTKYPPTTCGQYLLDKHILTSTVFKTQGEGGA
ncbi:unnamed protein product [Choristocarpus tenellus]